MCRMSSCLFSRLGKTLSLRTSLRMSPKSNERRVQRAFKHARHALIDRTLRSCSIDRPARRSRRWSTRPWSSLCRRRRRRHRRHRNGYKYTAMFRARNPHFRLLYGFADLPERGALTCTTLALRVDLPRRSTFPASACETNGNVTCGLRGIC